MSVFECFRKCDVARRKLRRKRIRIRNVNVSIPAGRGLSLVVWDWVYTDCLEHDHCTPSAHDAEEGVVGGFLKGDLKPKLVAVERKRCRCVSYDEKRRDTGDLGSGHRDILQPVPPNGSQLRHWRLLPGGSSTC